MGDMGVLVCTGFYALPDSDEWREMMVPAQAARVWRCSRRHAARIMPLCPGYYCGPVLRGLWRGAVRQVVPIDAERPYLPRYRGGWRR